MSDKFPISRRRFLQLIGGMTAFITSLPNVRKSFAARFSSLSSSFSRQVDDEQPELVKNVRGQAIIPFHGYDPETEMELELGPVHLDYLEGNASTIVKCHLSHAGTLGAPEDLIIVVEDIKICGTCALVLTTFYIEEEGEPLDNVDLLYHIGYANIDIVTFNDDTQQKPLAIIREECADLFGGDDENPLEENSVLEQLAVGPYVVNSLASGQPDTGPPDSGSGGGPGCKPRRVNGASVMDSDWQFDLSVLDEIEADSDPPDPSECLVFILDTIPPALDDLRLQDQCLLDRQLDRHNHPLFTMANKHDKFDAMLTTLDTPHASNSLLDSLLTGFSKGSFNNITYEKVPCDETLICGGEEYTETEHVLTVEADVLSIEYNRDLRLDGMTPPIIPDGDKRIVRKVASGNHDYPYFAMDHGLFIAGIIYSIAQDNMVEDPQVKLHMYEVLNAFAYGTLDTFFWGLDRICSKVSDQTTDNFGKSVIINASLTFEFDKDDLDPETFAEIFTPDELDLIYNSMVSSLQQAIDCFEAKIASITGKDPIIVAAAGNEGDPNATPQHPDARLPAGLQGVLGVASTEQSGTDLLDYSNKPPTNLGFSVFGGERTSGNENFLAHPDQGILGLHIGAFPPQGPIAANGFQHTTVHPPGIDRGWARWAGTSFSTAIVTGALVNLIKKGVSNPVGKLAALNTDGENSSTVLDIHQ